MNKTGSVIATTLIIIALLVTSGVLLYSERSPLSGQPITKAADLFRRLVFTGTDDFVKEYAENGYTVNSSLWMCKGTSTPPSIGNVTSGFQQFTRGRLDLRLQKLKTADPSVVIAFTAPNLTLSGPVSPTTVDVTISQFNVTIFGADENLTLQLDSSDQYQLQFWRIYQVVSEWTKCAEANVYDPLQAQLADNICSFHKNLCPGPNGTEACGMPNSKLLQDFNLDERSQLAREYGVKNSELRAAAAASADSLNRYFSGAVPLCQQPRLAADSGIRCTAQIRGTNLRNDLWSTFSTMSCADNRETPGPYCNITTFGGMPGRTGYRTDSPLSCVATVSATPNPLYGPYGPDYYSINVEHDLQVSGDSNVKCAASTSIADRILGTVGYMDAAGDYELLITCSDSGAAGTDAMIAQMNMHISFRHICELNQQVMYEGVDCPPPPGDAAAAGPNVCAQKPCPGEKDACSPIQCIVCNPTSAGCNSEGYKCEEGAIPVTCTPQNALPCTEYVCAAEFECVPTPQTGNKCGDGGCGTCQAGSCAMGGNIGATCAPSGGVGACQKGECSATGCTVVPKAVGDECYSLAGTSCVMTCDSGGNCGNLQGGSCTKNCLCGDITGTCAPAGGTIVCEGSCPDGDHCCGDGANRVTCAASSHGCCPPNICGACSTPP